MEVHSPQLHTPFAVSSSAANRSKQGKSHSKQLQQLFAQLSEASALFDHSSLSKSLEATLKAKGRPQVTRIVSLGLGSLVASKDQSRRIKQLVILLAIASHLSADAHTVPVYAQDPAFTKTDEQFLRGLGVQVLKTPSASDLGEARRVIDGETLVYSPFLTIDAYRQLFTAFSNQQGPDAPVPMLVGDDFNALKTKWEKRTTEHRDVEEIMKGMRASKYQRRVLAGEGFWEEGDAPFPMALYSRQSPASKEKDASRAPNPKSRKSKL